MESRGGAIRIFLASIDMNTAKPEHIFKLQ